MWANRASCPPWRTPAPTHRTSAGRSWPTRPSSTSSIPTASWPRWKTPRGARSLMATPPAGDASQAASAGSNLYSGSAQQSMMDNFHNTQETLDTLAADTGGKALLDSNDLTLGMTQVQKDMSSYYMLTYASSNTAEDGKYRRIQVKLAPKLADLRAKLDYRQGYYAPTIFAK